MNKEFVIGIDLGGTKINTAIVDFQGNIIKQINIPTLASEGENVVLNRIIKTIDEVLNKSEIKIENIRAIGIGAPGPLDSKEGIIITTPNLPFKNFNIINPIKKIYNINTYIDNDGNVAAIGEHTFGAGKGSKNMIYITVSTGIGGGAILNGNIYRGNTCNALEVGHMTLDPKGPLCNCGNYGCAEVLASGTSIGRQGRQAIEKKVITSLSKYSDITAYEVFNEAKNGDKVCSEIVNKSLNYLGICIANLVSIFDPEVVIIGGGVSKAGEVVFNTVKDVVKMRCFKILADSCEILPAKLSTNSGVIGAAALALREENIL
ncbi:ROK family protein [Clostridium sp. HMP27]|uniref:ROK family protein n=1 Tax=Clostridium sp. HMP27 TaxID=1487921 RepID=UPI00052CFE9C|nr:ROK family protein [Clostridium sp. HMP27]KGK88977.1 glucokinase [Clostridium sp. HMP27]